MYQSFEEENEVRDGRASSLIGKRACGAPSCISIIAKPKTGIQTQIFWQSLTSTASDGKSYQRATGTQTCCAIVRAIQTLIALPIKFFGAKTQTLFDYDGI